MIPELLLSLLGFTGGVVVEESDTFSMSLSFDAATEAERVYHTMIGYLTFVNCLMLVMKGAN